METVAQNAVGMGNICFSEKRQSNKWVAGELQQQQQARSEPHVQPWGASSGAVPWSNTWVTALYLIS